MIVRAFLCVGVLGGLSASLAMGGCSDDETGTHTPATTTSSQVGTGGSAGAGGGDGGTGGTCVNSLPNEMTAPATLSETGLYADIAQGTLADYVQPFEPKYKLWSDGADKSRWVYLPECSPVIDNSDQDNWVFPVGTRMWKEFSLNGVPLETRLVHRYGPGPADFLMVTYVWNTDNTEATLESMGVEDAKGTEHDIPAEEDCKRCHGGTGNGGVPSRFLGFSAIQLSHTLPGVTIEMLSDGGHLTNPAPDGFLVPGSQIEEAALGYLHANCGNCHNDTADGVVVPAFDVRVKAGDSDVPMTSTYQTLVNQATTQFIGMGCNFRIAGGNIADSCVHLRMSQRGSDGMPNNNQMPPVASDVVDITGLAAIDAWIGTLPSDSMACPPP